MFSRKAAPSLSQEEIAFATLLANYDGCKRVFAPGATLTLTQIGLLAVLLQRQRYKAIELTLRRARREKMHATVWTTLKRLFHVRALQAPTSDSAKPLIGTVPRHT
jgi:hypothetical protein